MEDKRSYVRIPGEKFKIKIRKLSDNVTQEYHDPVDICENGLLILFPQELEQGGLIEVTINCDQPELSTIIKCIAKIIRCKNVGDKHEIALQFIKIPIEELKELREFISFCSKS